MKCRHFTCHSCPDTPEDNPEWDATDYAHPAWWRGGDYATEMVSKTLLGHIERMEQGWCMDSVSFGSAKLQELFDKIVRLSDRSAFTHEWYAVRIERLKEFAKEKGIWHEVAKILANGTLTGIEDGKVHYEPPTYFQQMNTLKWQVEKLQKELADAKEEIARLQDRSKPDESA